MQYFVSKKREVFEDEFILYASNILLPNYSIPTAEKDLGKLVRSLTGSSSKLADAATSIEYLARNTQIGTDNIVNAVDSFSNITDRMSDREDRMMNTFNTISHSITELSKEVENIMNTYHKMDLNVIKLDYSELFYDKLHNITDPEEKRKIIGHTFIDVFTKYASEHNLLNPEYFLGQGTIYPDIIESGSNIGGSLGDKLKTHKIKSHHNVGGLPDKLPLILLEPLKHMFKYEFKQIS